ncbi:hypothetical protein H1C71_007771, partial [Ictidomys tridecemlineatus]
GPGRSHVRARPRVAVRGAPARVPPLPSLGLPATPRLPALLVPRTPVRAPRVSGSSFRVPCPASEAGALLLATTGKLRTSTKDCPPLLVTSLYTVINTGARQNIDESPGSNLGRFLCPEPSSLQ